MSPLNAAICTTTYLDVQKCYGLGKKTLFKKTTIWLWCQRSRSHEGHYGMRHTTLWSCTHIPNKYYLKNNYLTSRSKVPRRSLQYVTHRLMVMHPYQISLTYLERKKCYGLNKKILFKKQSFDLEVKVPRRSLWYVTHRLMVMHPHTKYNWPIWKDKQVMVQTSFAEKKQKQNKKSD
jgi:hypothetical protein